MGMSSTETPQPASQRLLTKNDLAGHYAITTRTVDNWIRRGMPYEPCGGAKRFRLDAVAAWLARDEQARLRARQGRSLAA
jgi:phage terminase Nu1 subunit (DNA packaging protein)